MRLKPLGNRMDRKTLDKAAAYVTYASALLSVSLFILILAGLILKSGLIISAESLRDLLLSSSWKPSKGEFGFYPFIVGTLYVTFLAMVFSVPTCLLGAIYLAEYSSRRLRSVVKACIDMLAGIPSVIFGLWGVLLSLIHI